jgi:SAM-dependent methyltransferase
LVAELGGSLEGKTVLDLGSNSGFWSIQAGLQGARVIGIEGRAEQVEQAKLIASISGVADVQFIHGDFWKIHEILKGQTFDAVLNLGILYHLPDPYHALTHLMPLINEVTVIDTTILKTSDPIIKIRWEEPDQIQQATRSGIVAIPSPTAIELMLKDLKFSRFRRMPVDVESPDCLPDFRDEWRGTWIAVK